MAVTVPASFRNVLNNTSSDDLECLIHADSSVGIVAFILCMDLHHGIGKFLIFPGVVQSDQIYLRATAPFENIDVPCAILLISRKYE